jgi:hypothetical protein
VSLTKDNLDAFHHSLDRVLASGGFLDHFYDAFIGGSDEVKAFFVHTEMAHQKRKLATTLRLMTMAADDSPGADIYLEYLGKYHRGIHVPEHLYQRWLEALIDSVRRCDPEFDTALETVWRAGLQIGIDNMLKAYDGE